MEMKRCSTSVVIKKEVRTISVKRGIVTNTQTILQMSAGVYRIGMPTLRMRDDAPTKKMV